MESHPVPQNVTTFEFHLVGDMTLKQFSYLASGLVLAYLTFLVLFSASAAIATPLIIFFSGFGAALAFLPIQDRPLDHWLGNFFRSVTSPTEGVWISPTNPKLEGAYLQDPIFKNRLDNFLVKNGYTLAKVEKPKVVNPNVNLRRIYPQPVALTPVTPPVRVATPTLPVQSVLTAEKLRQLASLSMQPHSQIPLTPTYPEPQQIPYPPANPPRVQPVQPQPTPVTVPQAVTAAVNKPVRAQIVLTSSPNVISGIATDPAGNYLEGVIVVVSDVNDLPVRALKSNKLGQFTGATPLPSAVYKLNLEKDGFIFDHFQLTLNGQVLPPLLITAKKGTPG